MRAREVYERFGSICSEKVESFGVNEFYKSENVTFIFYYDGLSRISTPDGEFVPLGSRVSGNEEKAFEETVNTFSLVHIKTTNKNYEQWRYYEMPK